MQLLTDKKNFIQDIKDEKLCPIDPDALDDYLNGGNNSQEQEEELLQYFQQSASSGGPDAEAINSATVPVEVEASRPTRNDKVSQLRLILQQNLKAGTVVPLESTCAASLASSTQPSIAMKPEVASQKQNLILPTLLSHAVNHGTRRRVSFDVAENAQPPNTVSHQNFSLSLSLNWSVQDCTSEKLQDPMASSNLGSSGSSGNTSCTVASGNTVPQSPNTRRRIFNFTPISPGPHSPINGRVSKSSSANASPFVSPRNTPVPRSRSNILAATRSRSTQKPLSRSISCSVTYASVNKRVSVFYW